MNIDLYLFNLINGFVGRWAWLDYLAIFFAHYCEYVLWFCLLLFLAFRFKKYWKMVFVALSSGVVSRFIVGSLIRFLWFRQRPFVTENFVPLIYQNPAEAAFPSGHALFYFAVSTGVFLYNKKVGILFYIASALIAISRVYVGVHWPLDILVGALLGILTSWVLNRLFKKYVFKYINL